MKKTVCVVAISVLVCACLFAGWSFSRGELSTNESGQLSIGTPDLEKKLLSSEVKGANNISLKLSSSSLGSTYLTEWDSTENYRVTLFANVVKLYSADNSINQVFIQGDNYSYNSKGYIYFSNGDFLIYLFEGLCAGKDMTIELFSYAGESRKYIIKAADAFPMFFEYLRYNY